MSKIALYGNTLDYIFIKSLNSNGTLLNYLKANKIKKRDGLKRDVLSEIKINNIDTFITEKDNIFSFYSPIKAVSLENNELKKVFNLFGKDKIILKGQTKNETELVVSFSEGNTIFRNDTFIISSDYKELKELYALLIANILRIFFRFGK